MGPPTKGSLSDNEKTLLEKVTSGTIDEVRALLQQPDVRVQCLDDTGMTPLQHAAFRNKLEVAELLLKSGADVNSNHHENGYSALMFASLSGGKEITRLMLQAGAKKDHINSVGRNAAQMGAFVGQHQCVGVINNFYAREDLEYYTKIHGVEETEPKLPQILLPSLLKLLNMSNLHPVKVSLHVREHSGLLTESYRVCKVLDSICERAMKSRDTDDVMAVKAHYFASVIRHAKDVTDINAWIKKLLQGRPGDGYPEFQDQVIRQSLREFPYVESQLLQNMVRQLSSTKIGSSPTSVSILMQAVNGQKFGGDDDEDCYTCGEPKAPRKCSQCKMAHYCNQECQKFQWPSHKKFCKQLAVVYVQREEMREQLRLEDEERQKQAELEKQKQAELEKQMEQTCIAEQPGENDGETKSTNEDEMEQESEQEPNTCQQDKTSEASSTQTDDGINGHSGNTVDDTSIQEDSAVQAGITQQGD